MKVLITSDWYDYAVNGVVRSVLNLEKGLKERGHEVRVLTLSTSVHSYKEDNVYYIGAISAGAVYPGARVRTSIAHPLVKELIDWKPDVIHSNCEMSTFMIARKIAKHCGVPLVHTYHTVYEDYTHYFSPSKRVGKALVKKFSRVIAHRTSAVIVPSFKVKSLLEEYGVDAPLYVIPTGIDQSRFTEDVDPARISEIKEKLGIPPEGTVAIYIGRLAKEKHVEKLIDYFGDLENPDLTFVIVGDGPARKSLEAKAADVRAKESAPKIIFAGAVKPEEVGTYYHLGDIFVSASTSETQGLTYFEALSCGLPLLCRKDDCLEGIVEGGVNGWQFTGRNDFTEHIKEFVRMEGSGEEMKSAAHETGKKFSVASFAEEAEKVYDESIKGYYLRPMAKRHSRVKTTGRALARKIKRTRGVKTARKVVSGIRSIRLLP